jgi:hypothetical protein
VAWPIAPRSPDATNGAIEGHSLPARIIARWICAAISSSLTPAATASIPARIPAAVVMPASRISAISSSDLISRPCSTTSEASIHTTSPASANSRSCWLAVKNQQSRS